MFLGIDSNSCIRISKGIGRNLAPAPLGTFIKVGLHRFALVPTRLMLLVGQYLGIDVAIKEVLPSNDYDVAKYFEREWRLMK